MLNQGQNSLVSLDTQTLQKLWNWYALCLTLDLLWQRLKNLQQNQFLILGYGEVGVIIASRVSIQRSANKDDKRR